MFGLVLFDGGYCMASWQHGTAVVVCCLRAKLPSRCLFDLGLRAARTRVHCSSSNCSACGALLWTYDGRAPLVLAHLCMFRVRICR